MNGATTSERDETERKCHRFFDSYCMSPWTEKWWSYSSSQKNRDVLVPPCSVTVAPFMQAVVFPFHMHTGIISNWAWSFNVQTKGRPACQLTDYLVLYCYGLLNCSGAVHHCFSKIMSEVCDWGSIGFEVGYRWSIYMYLVLPINSHRL